MERNSLKSFNCNILAFAGIGPNRATLIGMVEGMSDEKCRRRLARIEALGREGW